MRAPAFVPRWAAAIRLARRDADRHRWRSALVAGLIALPVLAASAVAVVERSGERGPAEWTSVLLGRQAQALVTLRGTPVYQTIYGLQSRPVSAAYPPVRPVTAARLQAWLPPGDSVVPQTVQYADHTLQLSSGHPFSAEVWEFDYSRPGLAGLVDQVSGRAPRAAGEVVVSQQLARDYRLKPGDPLTFTARAAPSSHLRVVGVVGGLPLIGHPAVIGSTGQLLPGDPAAGPASGPGPIVVPIGEWRPGSSNRTLATPTSYLVTGPRPVTWPLVEHLNQAGLIVTSRQVLAHPPSRADAPYYRDPGGPTSGTFVHGRLVPVSTSDLVGVAVVATGLILLQIALLAGPAIAVGARRHERSLALVAASGGDRRDLRAVVVAGAGVLGLAASVTGALLGSGVGVAAVHYLRAHRDQQLARIDVRIGDLAVLVALGTLTAVAAALVPARWAGRLDVVAVLTGRRARAATRRPLALAGGLLTLAGCVICFLGATHRQPFVTVAGIGVAEAGLVALAGPVVTLIARAAGGLPFPVRFALRDAARQRARTAPAVAAVMAAVAGTMALGVYLSSQDAQYRREHPPALPPGVADVWSGSADDPAGLAAAVAAVRGVLPVQRVVPIHRLGPAGRGQLLLGVAPIRAPGQNCRWSASLRQRLAQLKDDPRCTPDPRLYLRNRSLGTLVGDGPTLSAVTGRPQPAATAALAAGRVVVFDRQYLWPGNTVHIVVDARYEDPAKPRFTATYVLPATWVRTRPGVTGALFPASAAGPLHLTVISDGAFVVSRSDLSGRDAARADDAVRNVAPAGGFDSPQLRQAPPPRPSAVLLTSVAAAALVSLLGTLAAVALAAQETRPDLATLAAVGAAPAARRRLLATQALVISGTGVVLGGLSGLLAGWALVRLHAPSATVLPPGSWLGALPGAAGWPYRVPGRELAVLAVGLPALAAGAAFLAGLTRDRARPARFRRTRSGRRSSP